MKMRLWFMYLLLCIVLLSSCAVDGAAETFAETGEFHSVTQEVFPDAPPTLTVVYGEEQITAWRGTYSWETVNALGIGQAVQADSMHPLDAVKDFPEEFPVLHVAEGESVALYCDAIYDSRTVRYYPDGWVVNRQGVKINHEIRPTLEGIRDGRDEMLEAALRLIEEKTEEE